MSQSARFPYVPVVTKRGEAVAMPLLPMELRLAEGQPVRVQSLLDSGATVNVLPFTLGQRVGFVWENQKTVVSLTGNLAAFEARAVLLMACVAEFPPVRLVFA